jgi:hypothetical protein
MQMQNWINSEDQDDQAIREIFKGDEQLEDNLLLDQDDPLHDEQ